MFGHDDGYGAHGRVVGGPATDAIVAAFLNPRSTMSQRISKCNAAQFRRTEDQMTPEQTPPAEEYRELAGRFTELVEGVPDQAAWNRAAPVEDWNARDIVRHLVEWFPPFLHEAPASHCPPVRTSMTTRQPRGASSTTVSKPFSTIRLPGTKSSPTRTPVRHPPTSGCGAVLHRRRVHAQLGPGARYRSGRDPRPERCAMMLTGMESWDEVLRSSGQYGPRVNVPDDSDVQTRFLAFIGRDPRP